MKVLFGSFRIAMALIFLYAGAPALLAQDPGMEIPITASSEKAVQKYIEGRNMSEDFQTAKALTLFTEAIEIDPNFALSYIGKALTAGDYAVTTKCLDKAAALTSSVSPGEKLYITYYQAAISGDAIKQHETLDKLVEMYPSDKRVLLMAGAQNYGDGAYDKAVTNLKKAVTIDPNFAPAYNLLGYSYAGTKNYAEAEKALKTYTSLRPNLSNAYDSYAEILRLEGKYDESITQYNIALEKDPQFLFSLQGIGDNYCFKKEYAKARDYYRKQNEMATTNNVRYAALYNIAVSYVKEGNTKEAQSVLEKRMTSAEKNGDIPTVVSSLNSQGFIFAESGDPDKAMRRFQTALEKIEGSKLSADVKKNMTTGAKLNVIYGMALQNKLDASEKKLNEIEGTALNSGNPDDVRMFNFVKGTLALKQDKPEEAVQYFSKAGDENPLAWRYEAIALHKTGETSKAIELRTKIQTFNQNNLAGALSTYNFQDLAELEPE